MAREAFFPPEGPRPAGPYSPAVRSGSVVVTAGQCGYLPDKSLVAGLEGQVHQAMRNLLDALASAGCDQGDVVAVNVFLADGDDFDRMNAVYGTYFEEPYPVRTTVTVGLRPGVLFEVNAQAVTA